MTPLRKTSLTAGILYLLTFVSIPAFILYGPIHESDFILGADSDTKVIIGNILELVVALAGIGTAVVLYPVLKKQNKAMSLALVGARILEAATIFVGVLFLLTVVSLHRSSVGTEALAISHTLVTMYDHMFLIGQSLMPAVDDILLGILLYHSRLVPRGLSIIGIIGGPILLIGTFSVMFGLLSQREPLAGLSALFVAVFEFSLGIYLITKGFKSSTLNKS